MAVVGYEAINLLQNLENRIAGYNNFAISVASPLTRLTQRTCFKSKYQDIKLAGNKLIIGLDFTESVFIHAILHAQD